MTDDVVAELDRWLEQWDSGYFVAAPSLETIPLVHRARDEIVALRARWVSDVDILLEVGRNEALEEAARVVEDYFNPETSGECAAAIRALKER